MVYKYASQLYYCLHLHHSQMVTCSIRDMGSGRMRDCHVPWAMLRQVCQGKDAAVADVEKGLLTGPYDPSLKACCHTTPSLFSRSIIALHAEWRPWQCIFYENELKNPPSSLIW